MRVPQDVQSGSTAAVGGAEHTGVGDLYEGLRRCAASAVSHGVWATPLPFPSPLGYSFSYSVEVDDGIVVVDLGWDSDDGWRLFQKGLARAGRSLEDIVGVVITHVHPDHFGLASRIAASTSAWVAAHEAEIPLITGDRADAAGRFEEMYGWVRACGVPESELSDLRAESSAVLASMPLARLDRTLSDGDAVPGTGGALVAVHTPGHTPGHLCFHDRDRRVLFTGDHLLPRVTPNVSKRPRTGDDPLSDFTDSLRRVARVPTDTLVLPGHEWMFDRPQERTRVLIDHHRQRLDEVLRAVESGAQTVWEVTRVLAWARDFETFNPRARRQALGEAHSHLDSLVGQGRLVRHDGMPLRWSLAIR